MKKIIVAISGASGAHIGFNVLKALPSDTDKHLVMSEHAKVVLDKEMDIKHYKNSDIGASIASGSYGADIMMITPCSMNTLAKIACGIADDLVTRAASVMIKENKQLLLAPREMPFSAIALENMLKLSRLGVIIAPPVAAYYAETKTIEEMEDFFIGKWFDLLDIEHNLYKRWSSE
ncbi:UbiX family flavin prenyltransferase [Sulfurimonas sp. MAG313]|nr:UbiX family flavin prenyltransferase [Sulfurimonas sp. MAG313]MDF1882128.1 UbiX family flavin prenyltransferase [Sulfurimonas sp. MAG313]